MKTNLLVMILMLFYDKFIMKKKKKQDTYEVHVKRIILIDAFLNNHNTLFPFIIYQINKLYI